MTKSPPLLANTRAVRKLKVKLDRFCAKWDPFDCSYVLLFLNENEKKGGKIGKERKEEENSKKGRMERKVEWKGGKRRKEESIKILDFQANISACPLCDILTSGLFTVNRVLGLNPTMWVPPCKNFYLHTMYEVDSWKLNPTFTKTRFCACPETSSSNVKEFEGTLILVCKNSFLLRSILMTYYKEKKKKMRKNFYNFLWMGFDANLLVPGLHWGGWVPYKQDQLSPL